MGRLITRAEWGAMPAKRGLQAWPAGKPDSKTGHYESTDILLYGKSKEDYDRIVRGIQAYHLHHPSEDYSDIAYNWVVSALGDWYEARGSGGRSGAQASGNPSSLSVCYIGGPNTPFTAEAQDGFIKASYGVGGPWLPHHHWIATSCPGKFVDAWIAAGAPGGGSCSCPVPAPPAPAPVPVDLDKYVAAVSAAALRDQNRRRVLLRHQVNPIVSKDVHSWQDSLNVTAHTNLVPDGRFGFATLGATVDFQRFWKLVDDGIVGNKTRDVMLFVLGSAFGV